MTVMVGIWQRCNRVHGWVLAVYTALAVGWTWPLAAHLSTHVPGSYTWAFDEYTFLWNSWWFRYALLDLGQNPLYSTHTFYPVGVSLVLYTYNLFNALVSVPLQPFLSLPAISNLTFLFATALSAYGAFLLAGYLIRTEHVDRPNPAASGQDGSESGARIRSWAAFVAGLIYGFGSYRMVYAAIGHYDMWSTEWIPFYALFLVKSLREPGWRNAALAGLFLALAMLCEMIFGVFLGMLALILLLFALGRRRRPVAGGPLALAGRLALMAAVALVLYLPVLMPILREMSAGYDLAGWGDAQKLSVDLVGLVSPTALHPLDGDWATELRQVREGTGRFSDVHTVFLGWAGPLLAVVGAIRYRRHLAAWIASAMAFAVLALGPVLQIRGRSLFDFDGLQVNVPLPFIVLHYIPLVKANRAPNRFSAVLMLTLAVLAAFGLYWLLRKVTSQRGISATKTEFTLTPTLSLGGRGGRSGEDPRPTDFVGHGTRRGLGTLLLLAACGSLLFEHWSVPLPLTDARIPAVYAQVAAEPGDFAILQLPLGWRNSFGQLGAESTQTQYYQTAHHKRLLSGNISRNPPAKFDYFRRQPILDSLITLETYGQVDAARRAADRAIAGDFVSFYDLRYVIVAPGIPGRPPYVDTRGAAVEYVEEVLPVTKIYDREGWILYRVNRPAVPDALAIELGSGHPLAAAARIEGWGADEQIHGAAANWAIAQGASLVLPATDGAGYRLTATLLPFEYPEAPPQNVTLRVNGHRLKTITLPSGWSRQAWEVPGSLLHAGLNDVRFEFAWLAAPVEVVPGNGAIGGTGVPAPVPIEVNSGGPAGFAYITIGEGDRAVDGSIHSPGYNVAVLDPQTGRVLERRGFDLTTGDPAQVAALRGFLAGLPPGRIAVVALQGEVGAELAGEVGAVFGAIGGQADLRGARGWSHALVGVKGAAPGTALEAAGPENSWLRVAPDRRTLGAAVHAIEWNRIGVQGTAP